MAVIVLTLCVEDDACFYSVAAGPFGLLRIFWKSLVGLCAMVMPCDCNSLLVVSDIFLIHTIKNVMQKNIYQ